MQGCEGCVADIDTQASSESKRYAQRLKFHRCNRPGTLNVERRAQPTPSGLQEVTGYMPRIQKGSRRSTGLLCQIADHREIIPTDPQQI